MKIREAYQALLQRLTAAGLPEPEADGYLLLEHALGLPRARIPLAWDQELTPAQVRTLSEAERRRLTREPVQHILGTWPFLELDLAVGPQALIPRPETEEWVAHLRQLITKRWGRDAAFRFADIGTGTGAIGLALAAHFPHALGLLTDLSREALQLSRQNAWRHSDRITGADGRLLFVQGHLLAPLRKNPVATSSPTPSIRQEKGPGDRKESFPDHPEIRDLPDRASAGGELLPGFHVLVSNPPYIPAREIDGLMPEVRDHDPRLALDGGPDGLDAIRHLLAEAGSRLVPGGLLAIEHGTGQRAAILGLPAPSLRLLETGDDLAGHDRYVVWEKLSSS